jgi:hypothetical protein
MESEKQENIDKAFIMFQRKLKQYQSEIIQICSDLEVIITGDNTNEKNTKIGTLIAACTKLIELGDSDTPQWVNQINEKSQDLIKDFGNLNKRRKLIDIIHQLRTEMTLHDWKIGGYDSKTNFESIYQKYKEESKLPDLFDELILLIEKMLSDSSFDLGKAENKFKFLLTVIRTNINKSFYSDQSVVNYLLYFIKEFLLNLSSRIPGVKEFLDAMIATAKKIKEEMDETKTKTEDEVVKMLSTNGLIRYDGSGIINEIEEAKSKKIDLLV